MFRLFSTPSARTCLLADTFLKQADAIWNSMIAAGETHRRGQRYTVERIDGLEGAASSRSTTWAGRRAEGQSSLLEGRRRTAGGSSSAYARSFRETRSLHASLKHLSREFVSEAFRDLRETSHSIALSRLVGGEWHNETSFFKYDIRAQMTKYFLDGETPEEKSASTPLTPAAPFG